jgi:hypothetical protein
MGPNGCLIFFFPQCLKHLHFVLHSHLIMYLALAALCLSATSSALSDSNHAAPPPVKNANHIFNAIQSSMRQWGSSLGHNGMSFFLAHIPAGTELYHGRGDNITVKGMEWLAFEPEHAMNFARKVIIKPRPPKDGQPPPDEHESNQQHLPRRRSPDFTDPTASRHQQLLGLNPQTPSPSSDKPPSHRRPYDEFEMLPGYLHIHTTTSPLRVLYLDGQSAAKSGKGTLDTQDYILSPHASGDYGRARAMCSLAANEWAGKIDGFIRMEHGFELILCDFEKSVELQRIEKVGSWDVVEANVGQFLFTFLKAITARYHGIGGERVRVEYGDFVTAFAEDIDLFGAEAEDGNDNDNVNGTPKPKPLPRLTNITSSQRERIMASLTALVLTDPPSPTINWQSITDLIIARYSSFLHTLAFGPILSMPSLHNTLTLLLRPFLDYGERDKEVEVQRCAGHFIPVAGNDADAEASLARSAILHVSRQICEVLFDALYASASSNSPFAFSSSPFPSLASSSQIRASILTLTTYLSWTTWKECRPGCRFDEFCLTAIWPIGDVRSHETPYCVNASQVEGVMGRPGGKESYWNDGRR